MEAEAEVAANAAAVKEAHRPAGEAEATTKAAAAKEAHRLEEVV